MKNRMIYSLLQIVILSFSLHGQSGLNLTAEYCPQEDRVKLKITNTSDKILVLLHSPFLKKGNEENILVERSRSETASLYGLVRMNYDSLIDPVILPLTATCIFPYTSFEVENIFSKNSVIAKHIEINYRHVNEYSFENFQKLIKEPNWYGRYEWKSYHVVLSSFSPPND